MTSVRIHINVFPQCKLCCAGLAEYFRNSSEEEREHAEKLMIQQVGSCPKWPSCVRKGLASNVCVQSCCRSLVSYEALLFAACDDGCAVQNRRGGRVKLLSILLPETEFNHKDKVRSLMSGPSELLMSTLCRGNMIYQPSKVMRSQSCSQYLTPGSSK